MTFAFRPTYRRLVEFNPGYCAEARTLFAAMTVQPTRGRKARINEFINRLKAASVWTKIDVMWVLAAHDEQAGRLNWKTPGTFTLTAVNAPAFTVDRGFTGDGSTSYLDTGWDAANNGVNFLQDDALVALYMRANGTGGLGTFGSRTNFSTTLYHADCRLNNAGSAVSGITGTQPKMVFGRRIAAGTVTVGVDGVQTNSGAQTSAARSNVDFAIGAAGTGFSGGQQAGALAAGYLDDTQNLAMYNAWHDYMVAIGADT